MLKVSLSDLQKLKREAKKLKARNPNTSHGQLLNIASNNICNVPSYHEARVINKAYLQSFELQNEELLLCSFCNFVIEDKYAVDVVRRDEEHRVRHLEYEKAEYRFGYLPPDETLLEADKKKAYEKLEAHNSLTIRIDGALLLIKTHFDRSIGNAITKGYWREHPLFEGYLAMIDGYDKIFSPDIMEYIRDKYGNIGGENITRYGIWKPQIADR